jgi:hypothetical protein
MDKWKIKMMMMMMTDKWQRSGHCSKFSGQAMEVHTPAGVRHFSHF